MKDLIKPSDSNRVLVIGNGFDLDLGWNTRFSDFAESEYWPKHSNQKSILTYLYRRHLGNWFDIEAEIGDYASGTFSKSLSKNAIDYDKYCFDLLVDGFKRYIIEETKKDIRQDCTASIVLSEILKNQYFKSIYSFNYTDLHEIAGRLGIKEKFSYEHVHGSIKNDSIIIGAPEDKQLNWGYEFLYKTFNANYESNNLIYDLREAKEIVFFGHSLGPTDYHYFRSFFKALCHEDLQRKDARKITIFTYDDASRISIMSQLRSMNEQKTNLLINQNDFKVIMTKSGPNQDLMNFVKHLRSTSKKAHEETIIGFSAFI